MQILVLYYSRTGNTKHLAEEVSKGVLSEPGASCIVRSTDEVTKEDFLNSQGIIAGSPTYFGGMAAPLKAIFDGYVSLRRQMENKIGAAFATSGDAAGGRETTILSILQAMLIYGMIIVGDPLDATGHYGVACQGNPNQTACANARKLGQRVARLALKIASPQ